MLSPKKIRTGIAMIELIFAIVIMGIVLMSIPNIVSISSRSTYTALQQESVAEATSTLNLVMTQDWDENATDGVVQTDSVTCTYGQRLPGVTAQDGRICVDRNASTTLGTEGGETTFLDYDDVDDFDGYTLTVTVPNREASYRTDQGDIIDKEINVTVSVSYGDDNSSANLPLNGVVTGTSGVKLISVDLSSNSPEDVLRDKRIRFSAFVCNIGKPNPIRTRQY